ncbi:MAG: small subunit ribosomal protein S1 [Candidatus Marinamargulisbacteria bacterium]|jgi:small subunit ribosomal protein S1
MSEGTKIGEFKDDLEFNLAVKDELETEGSDLKATKIGELSEFEKSLNLESPVNKSDNSLEEDYLDDASGSNEFEAEMQRMDMDYQEGDVIQGVVRTVEKGGVLVDIKYKSDGFIANSEFSSDPDEVPSKVLKAGDEVSVFILKLETKEGYTSLSRKRAEYENAWNTLFSLAKNKETTQVRIFSKVVGGLVADFKGIRGFIPASQVLKDSDESLDKFVNQKLDVTVLQADRRRRKVIFSHKYARPKAKRDDLEKLISEIEVGQVRDGKVTSIKDFGVFVDIGGIEGLVHISELSWSRVTHPSDITESGQNVKVFVLGVDKENLKISLGMKQLEPDPWVDVASKYVVGQVISGQISRVVPFGAFIQIENNLEGLIHISELSERHVSKVEDVLNVGDTIDARIIKLIPDEQKIGLSLKQLDGESSSVPESKAALAQVSEVVEAAEPASEEPVADSEVSEAIESVVEAPAEEPVAVSADIAAEPENEPVADGSEAVVDLPAGDVAQPELVAETETREEASEKAIS